MRVLLALTLWLGALMGVPIDPEKIREILAFSSRDEQAETAPERSQGDEDIEEYLNRRGLRSDRRKPRHTGKITAMKKRGRLTSEF